MNIISESTILLNGHAKDKEDAIKQAGNLLLNSGYISLPYILGMIERENLSSTYLDNGVAIPHGRHEHLKYVNATGISVVQLRDGVKWDSDANVHLVIGLAATSNDHIDILMNVAEIAEDPELVDRLVRATEPSLILERLLLPTNRDST